MQIKFPKDTRLSTKSPLGKKYAKKRDEMEQWEQDMRRDIRYGIYRPSLPTGRRIYLPELRITFFTTLSEEQLRVKYKLI